MKLYRFDSSYICIGTALIEANTEAEAMLKLEYLAANTEESSTDSGTELRRHHFYPAGTGTSIRKAIVGTAEEKKLRRVRVMPMGAVIELQEVDPDV